MQLVQITNDCTILTNYLKIMVKKMIIDQLKDNKKSSINKASLKFEHYYFILDQISIFLTTFIEILKKPI